MTTEFEDTRHHGSQLLGSLAEIRGFVTDAERDVLGDPARPTTTDDPFRDLCAASAAALDEDVEASQLQHLYGLRVEVACHCLASLGEDEIQKLSGRTSIPEDDLVAARSLASEALLQGSEARGRSLSSLLDQVIGEDEERGVNDLLGEVRKIGRWPGDPRAGHVIAYRRALGDAVLRHARIAFWFARQTVTNPSAPLLLAALEGLRQALERYDPLRGFALSTYAKPWVRQRVMRAITNHGAAVRAPVYFWEDRGRLLRAAHAHVAEHGSFPSQHELEQHPELSGRVRVEKVLRHGLVPLRDLWTQTCAGTTAAADALIAPNAPTERDERVDEVLQTVLDGAVESLGDRQQEIIRRRFGIGAEATTLRAIGEDHEVSRERIRQLQKAAVETLGTRVGAELAQRVHAVESA